MPAYAIDPNAVLWSAPKSERHGRPLIVLMHGWSYDETHLFAFRSTLPRQLVVASLRAPFSEAGGFAWFPSRGNPIGDPQPAVANAAVNGVVDWLDRLSAAPSTGLLGFSQGGGMVLQLLRHRPDLFMYGVQLAGFVVNDRQPGDATLLTQRPPVFWGRGERDSVIPRSAISRTEAWMLAHTDAETHVYQGLGHDVSHVEMTDAAAFVQRQL
jgi:phospholipase/carboxylesterase